MNETSLSITAVRFVGRNGQVVKPAAVMMMSTDEKEAIVALVRAKLGLA